MIRSASLSCLPCVVTIATFFSSQDLAVSAFTIPTHPAALLSLLPIKANPTFSEENLTTAYSPDKKMKSLFPPKYQISSEFPPNKETTWPYPPEKDGWVISHNALRGELQMMKEALQTLQERAQELQAWEIQAIHRALDVHLTHIHAHHRIEDEIFTPELKKRFSYPDKLTDDHDGLVNMLNDCTKTIRDLKPGDMVDAALHDWVKYQECMIPHLAEEEEIGLPLFRAYFTPEDASPLIMKIVQNSPKEETGSLIYFCGTKYWRTQFMVQEQIPWFVWYLDFQSKYKLFRKEFVGNLESVKRGRRSLSPFSRFSWVNAGN
jgi:hemerythrin-like domain-containing protein